MCTQITENARLEGHYVQDMALTRPLPTTLL